MSVFFQKELFLQWAGENPHLFSHTPFLDEEGDDYSRVRFRGITRHLVCSFTRKGDIMIMVNYRGVYFDSVMEFDLSEDQTPEGRYLCGTCRDWPSETNPKPLGAYNTREELWIKHSFEPLAEWTRETFTRDTMLCLCRYQGSTAAVIAAGEKLDKTRQRRDFFKEIPVVTGGGRKYDIPVSEMLTPSEIEQLRQEKKEHNAYAKEAFTRLKAR